MDDATPDTLIKRTIRFAGTRKQFVQLLSDVTHDWPTAGDPVWLGLDPVSLGGSPDDDHIVAAFRGPVEMSGISIFKTHGLIKARPRGSRILQITLEVEDPSWPDVEPYWARIVARSESPTSSPTEPATGPSPQPRIQDALEELKEYRRKNIIKGRVTILKTQACIEVRIDRKTVLKYEPELWSRWDDPAYP